MNTNRDPEFETFVEDASMKNSLGLYAGTAVLFLLGCFLLYWGVRLGFAPIFIMGLLPWGGIAFLLFRFKGELKGGTYWVNLFYEHPEKIIWIKPINVRHTAAFLITLYQEMHFQVRTSDGLSITIKCDSQQDQQVFFKGLHRCTPDAHIGYDERVEHLYAQHRSQFIELLKQENRYLPVTQFLSAPR
jgi:hypothetical protein